MTHKGPHKHPDVKYQVVNAHDVNAHHVNAHHVNAQPWPLTSLQILFFPLPLSLFYTHTHTHTHARTHTRTHAHKHAHTHMQETGKGSDEQRVGGSGGSEGHGGTIGRDGGSRPRYDDC